MSSVGDDFAYLNQHIYTYLGLNISAVNRRENISARRAVVLTFLTIVTSIQLLASFLCRGNVECEFKLGDHSAYYGNPKEAFRLLFILNQTSIYLCCGFVLYMLRHRPQQLRKACSVLIAFKLTDQGNNEFLQHMSSKLRNIRRILPPLRYFLVTIYTTFDLPALVLAYLDGVNVTTTDCLWLLRLVPMGLANYGLLTSFSIILFLINESIMFQLNELKQTTSLCFSSSSHIAEAIEQFHIATTTIHNADILLSGFFVIIMVTHIPIVCILASDVFFRNNVVLMALLRMALVVAIALIMFALYYASRIWSVYYDFYKTFVRLSITCRDRHFKLVNKAVRSFAKRKTIGFTVGSLTLITKSTSVKIMLIIMRLGMKCYNLRQTATE